jgi:hypothetical protein
MPRMKINTSRPAEYGPEDKRRTSLALNRSEPKTDIAAIRPDPPDTRSVEFLDSGAGELGYP